ncbi:T9SS type A sorting domain-containing protein [Fluviicola taffensis]|uniref:CHU large protein, SAP or adhesin AidA-related protein n=1 Tax=Fluviicola taffensis (strain DSM 16823 / NCIMB 13979 / RW262) TaxID=755732 RepID=F2IG81_FLUTR|nr:T9SS type A sorting domain-containing protein [Fluviicola taffensis]AEA44716.1 CHU large protein, SAP or adhesin AidA-related protein [Fluviicola taffensis DSM 16823]
MKQFQQFIVLTLFFIGTFSTGFSQCPSGAIGVSGPGCGCLSGCNLTSVGGPNCSPSVGGNCDAGYLPMQVDINVPAGCTYTVSATMRDRPGCTNASGADGNCQTCDVVKVDIIGGGKIFQQGGSNSTLNDSYTLAGPGTIRVSGRANRADEIITYSTTSSGATCVNCNSVLPIELTAFTVSLENNAVTCDWWTETELNNDYFTIERSADGIHFEYVGSMKGAGTSLNPLRYKIYDYDPYLDIVSYYRLSQTDFDGTIRYQDLKSIKPKRINELTIYPNPSSGSIHITGDIKTLLASKLYDVTGKEIKLNYSPTESNGITISALSVGVYTFVYFDNEKMISERILITP